MRQITQTFTIMVSPLMEVDKVISTQDTSSMTQEKIPKLSLIRRLNFFFRVQILSRKYKTTTVYMGYNFDMLTSKIFEKNLQLSPIVGPNIEEAVL